MAVKVYVILAILVFAGVVMPVAHAQLNLGGLLNGFGLLRVNGVVPCSDGNSITSSGFPNAGVQLRCGGNSNIVGSSTTNSNGAFSIVGGVPLSDDLLLGFLSSCRVYVTTPLASCNVSFPSTGSLTAPVKPVSSLLGNIISLVTGQFSLDQN